SASGSAGAPGTSSRPGMTPCAGTPGAATVSSAVRISSRTTWSLSMTLDAEAWPALSELLNELLDLDPHERSIRLAVLRAGGPNPVAAEAQRLLDREPELDRRGFLRALPGLSRSPEPSLEGAVVGPYTLERPLGHGGMGSVWLARRSDGRFEGKVAIKFLNLALIGGAGAARFRREGDALARLTHPNVARLLDAGVASSGEPYLVLEHVEGEPIDVWCDRRQTSIPARVRLFLEVCAAVDHAHRHLLLHRDLKPSNILVTEQGTVKLLDFGIAKLLDEGSEGRDGITG